MEYLIEKKIYKNFKPKHEIICEKLVILIKKSLKLKKNLYAIQFILNCHRYTEKAVLVR